MNSLLSHSGYWRILVIAALSVASLASAQESAPTEYELKAAFLYNFAKFVEWPSSKLPEPTAPIIIGVIGDDPFKSDLEKTLVGKQIDQRGIVIRRYKRHQDVSSCHILFISGSEQSVLNEILAAVEHAHVLTVGDHERFAERGALISFRLSEGKVRFLVNLEAAEQAGIRISSKLLRLAQIVSTER